jgi:DNA-binding beta-propeller fold protein YncE
MTLEGSLYTVDTSTAAVTLVGEPDQGGWAPEGLIYDQLTEQLVTVGADYVTLVPVDPATDTFGTMIGQFSSDGIDLGATYDPDNSQYLVLQASGTMIDIDPRNDYAATSTTGLPAPSAALAYVPATLN